MQFLQPFMLWGLLGISIPILIHLWRGNRGVVMDWAAMHWLSDKESSVVKGLKLENILVLVLRIIMLVLFVLLLSKVFLTNLGGDRDREITHLVQPSQEITDEYRFELSQAIERGENVFWASSELRPITSVDELSVLDKEDFELENALSQLPSDTDSLIIYLSNSSNELESQFYNTPVIPQIYLSNSDFEIQKTQVIQDSNKKLFTVNEIGLFDSLKNNIDQSVNLILKQESFNYFIDELNDDEVSFIDASFQAIEEIYGFKFIKVSNADSAKIIFSPPTNSEIEIDKLYFNIEDYSFENQVNSLNFSDKMDFENSELVRSGQLPEIVLRDVLQFVGVQRKDVSLSDTQVKSRFLLRPDQKHQNKSNTELILLCLFVLVYAMERYFAQKQGI